LHGPGGHNELQRGRGNCHEQPLGSQVAQRAYLLVWSSAWLLCDFAIFTPDYFLELWKKISSLIFILMFAVASVGLIVGGIGVMNIILVSVTERTREIGVRKVIGAKRSNILVQFLIEAVTLSVIGVIFGSGISLLLHYGAHFPAALLFFWIITAQVFCALIGIVFGVYPAWKAARLDSVEALRYE